MKNGHGVERFVDLFMRPPHLYKLLILQPLRWWHLDFMADEYHSPGGRDSELLRLMYGSWQFFRGEKEHPVEQRGHVAVYLQANNFECGHCCLRNVLVYLKYRPKNPSEREVSLFGDFYSPVAHDDILIQTMSFFSREMDPERRDERVSAPFVPAVGPSLPDDACPLFMDGKLIKAPPKKYHTRQNSKTQGVDLPPS